MSPESSQPMDDLEKIARAIVRIRHVEEPVLLDGRIAAIRAEYEIQLHGPNAASKATFADYLRRELMARGLTSEEISIVGISKATVIRALERRSG